MSEGGSELSVETADALMAAIKEAAPDIQNRSVEGLKHLAEAYAAVEAARPKKPGHVRSL
jgi:predicted nuclease of restriction endonuclease-like RecB superfamily